MKYSRIETSMPVLIILLVVLGLLGWQSYRSRKTAIARGHDELLQKLIGDPRHVCMWTVEGGGIVMDACPPIPKILSGSTAQRPPCVVFGDVYENTDNGHMEICTDRNLWSPAEAGGAR